MNTHETYVSLKTSQLLKRAGFDWGCDTFYGLDVRYKGKSIDEDKEYELKVCGKGKEIEYVDGGMVYNFYHTNKEDEDFGGYSRPTLSIAQKWLREIKDYDVYVFPTNNVKRENVYSIGIKYFGRSVWIEGQPSTNEYLTYESALEAGINKCLTILLKED